MKMVVVGDCTIDDYGGQVFPGGCGLNVAVSAFRAGLGANLISCVGSDKYSKLISQAAKLSGINFNHVSRLPGKTPRQTIKLGVNGYKKLVKFYPGVLTKWFLSEQEVQFINKHEFLVTVYFEQIKPVFNQLMLQKRVKATVVDFMDCADFSFDLGWLKKQSPFWQVGVFGLENGNKAFINQLVKMCQVMGKMAIITLGDKGSVVVAKNKIYQQSTRSIKEIVDTTGCGDAYLGTFLAKWLTDNKIIDCMKIATEVAANTAGHKGGFKLK